MKLLGISFNVIPYVPLCERDADKPTVFWIKPKSVGLCQMQLDFTTIKDIKNSGDIYYQQKQNNFINICESIDNVQFSDETIGLKNNSIVQKLSNKELIKLYINQLPYSIIEEILDYCDEISHLTRAQYKLFELITYFALHRNEEFDISTKLSYSCDNCQVMKSYENRHCFKKENEISLILPKLKDQDEETGLYDINWKVQEEQVTAEDVLESFTDISEKTEPSTPCYLALLRYCQLARYKKELCITGLASFDFLKVFDWAIDCKNMKTLPFPGSYFEQPNQLIEAFKAINETIAQYEKVKLDKIKSKGKVNAR
jgi:hypothetical protein